MARAHALGRLGVPDDIASRGAVPALGRVVVAHRRGARRRRRRGRQFTGVTSMSVPGPVLATRRGASPADAPAAAGCRPCGRRGLSARSRARSSKTSGRTTPCSSAMPSNTSTCSPSARRVRLSMPERVPQPGFGLHVVEARTARQRGLERAQSEPRPLQHLVAVAPRERDQRGHGQADQAAQSEHERNVPASVTRVFGVGPPVG